MLVPSPTAELHDRGPACEAITHMGMPIPASSQFLTAIHGEVKRQGTNSYRLAKISGIPLTTVQRLLVLKTNLPLRNIDILLCALGLDVTIVATHGRVTGVDGDRAT